MTDISKQVLVIAANQLGATLLADNAQWRNRLQIRSSTSDRLYVVAQRKSSNEWGCTCMGWKRHRTCKHLKTMLPMLAAPTRRTPVR